jgi:deoxycytidylate deaminase
MNLRSAFLMACEKLGKKTIDNRECAKRTVIAVIVKDEDYVLGSNWCENPQIECPRKNMPTGVGYELCKEICGQQNHAEVDACINAGEFANGADLYLFGHDYCCKDCKKVMVKYGIKNIHILSEK